MGNAVLRPGGQDFRGRILRRQASTQTPDGVMLTLEVRSEFLRGWIEKNYLTDLNHSWGEVICSRPVIGVELKTKEATA